MLQRATDKPETNGKIIQQRNRKSHQTKKGGIKEKQIEILELLNN